MLSKSITSNADALCFDLEDSVAAHRKGTARAMVVNALQAFEHGKHEKLVRINSLPTGLAGDDLEVIAPCERLNAIVIPKVQTAADIKYVADALDALGNPKTKDRVKIVASIESALAIMNLKEIATASPRVDALLFAAEDYCADMQIKRSGQRTEMLYARSAIVTAAKAYGLQAIDLVCVNYKDLETLKEECEEGSRFGFDGKQAIHPNQVDIIQSMFVPTEKELQRAADILSLYEVASQGGRGAFGMGGAMIDAPMLLQANSIIAKAKAAGMPIPVGRRE